MAEDEPSDEVARRKGRERTRKYRRRIAERSARDPQFSEKQRLKTREIWNRWSHKRTLRSKTDPVVAIEMRGVYDRKNKQRNERRKKDPEKYRKRSADWREAHPRTNRDIERDRQYRLDNEERIKKRIREWLKDNPHKLKAYHTNRKARKRNAKGSHTADDILSIFRSQHGRCACCGKALYDGFHVDHITPLSKGGSNERKNLQITCQRCNLSKRDKDPIDFMREKGRLL